MSEDLIAEHETWLEAAGRSKRTWHARTRILRHAQTHLPHGLDAHTEELAAYLANPDWSAWTRHTYFGHLVGFYRWGYAARKFEINPMSTLLYPPEGDRIPDPATEDELRQALAQLPAQPWGMAVRLAAYAGLRCCEIVVVRRQDCTAQALRVVGKGGKTRTVSMAAPLWAHIADRPKGLLCVGAKGGPLTAQMLTQMQGPWWRRIGQPEQHMHRFRHRFATELLRQRVDIRVIQRLMGHRSILSTQGYTQVVDIQCDDAVSRLRDVEAEQHEPGCDRLVPPAAEAA